MCRSVVSATPAKASCRATPSPQSTTYDVSLITITWAGAELAFRGREADFPPGKGNVTVEERVWVLNEVFMGTEAALLLEGIVLRLQADLRWLEACERNWTGRKDRT